jgi:hypothetical protein
VTYPFRKDSLDQIGINRGMVYSGIFQPASKLPLLTGGFRLTSAMNTPLAHVNAFLHKHAHNRPSKGDQATHIVKLDSGVQNHLNYGTIKSETVYLPFRIPLFTYLV